MALNVKQITLSRRVKQLEDRLGVKLFDRSTRGAEITENGRPFIEQAEASGRGQAPAEGRLVMDVFL